MPADGNDDFEYVLLNKRECFVYQVPPTTSASGYKAADWDKCIWRGRLQICAKGDVLIIKLLDSSSGAIFAACPVPSNQPIDRVVERTTDSSRYFVLSMSDKAGRKALIGMGFDDRNDAFDFNASLQDFRRQREASTVEIAPVKTQQTSPACDLSLKQGERISVQLKGVKAPATTTAPIPTLSSPADSFLPPPPASRSRNAGSSSIPAATVVTDLLGLSSGTGISSKAVSEASPLRSQPKPSVPQCGSLLDD